jgi:integrase
LGEHPKVIADRLGHTSVRTVLDVYGHLYEGVDEAAAEWLDAQITSRRAARPYDRQVLGLRDRR